MGIVFGLDLMVEVVEIGVKFGVFLIVFGLLLDVGFVGVIKVME